jgi:ABC-type spermidine/putrescine transport system permease subunit II
MLVYASVRLGLSPQVNALATLWILVVAMALLVALRLGGRRRD